MITAIDRELSERICAAIHTDAFLALPDELRTQIRSLDSEYPSWSAVPAAIQKVVAAVTADHAVVFERDVSDQPRGEHGKWVATGGSAPVAPPNTQNVGPGKTDDQSTAPIPHPAGGTTTATPAQAPPRMPSGPSVGEGKPKPIIPPGNLGLARIDMPQIAGKNVPAFLDFLAARGIKYAEVPIPVKDLKGTQKEINPEKSRKLLMEAPKEKLRQRVLGSNDNYILDGHHRWDALYMEDPSNTMQVLKIDLPIRDLLTVAKTFPLTEYKEFSAVLAEPATDVAAFTAARISAAGYLLALHVVGGEVWKNTVLFHLAGLAAVNKAGGNFVAAADAFLGDAVAAGLNATRLTEWAGLLAAAAMPNFAWGDSREARLPGSLAVFSADQRPPLERFTRHAFSLASGLAGCACFDAATKTVNGRYPMFPPQLPPRDEGPHGKYLDALHRATISRLPPPGEWMPVRRLPGGSVAPTDIDHPGATPRSTSLSETLRDRVQSPYDDGLRNSARAVVSNLSTPEAQHVYRSVVSGGVTPSTPAEAGELLHRALGRSTLHQGEDDAAPLADRMASFIDGDRIVAALAKLAIDGAGYRTDYLDAYDGCRQAMTALKETPRQDQDAPIAPWSDRLTRDFRVSLEQAVIARRKFDDRVAFARRRLIEMIPSARHVKWAMTHDGAIAMAGLKGVSTGVNFVASLLTHKPGEAGSPRLHFTPADPKFQRSEFIQDGPADATIRLAARDGDTAIIHLLGHAIEAFLPGAKDAARQFLASRVADESPIDMSLVPGGVGLAGESGSGGSFAVFFRGTDAYYAGKKFESGTEVIPMGLEALYRDAPVFAATDPTFAKFIIGLLQGVLR